MSSVLGTSHSSAAVSAAQLRQMLEQALPSDAQLDAFCIDYAPIVHRQFSSGMERTRKLNLLLASTPPEKLLEHLRCHAATVLEQDLALLACTPATTSGLRGESGRTGSLGSALIGSLGVAIGIAGLVLLLRSPHDQSASLRDVRTGREPYVPVQEGSTAAVNAPWLTSDPPSALIYIVPSGILLGQTPWAPEPASPWHMAPERGLQVCLRSAGFVPVLVRLEPGADPSRPLPIHVRLQREPRAARQRDLGQEACNVPTPILE